MALDLENLTVRSQLIPLEGMRLVLPNTSIAEVVTQQTIEEIDNAPAWVMGSITWRGIKIPLLSYEAAVGLEAAKYSKGARVVVINATTHSDTLAFYAFIAQGIPRLMALNESAIIDAPDQEDTPFVLRHTLIDANPAIIPDLGKLESELNQAGMTARELV
jgi:chemosensory pili system protein ChpC